MIKEMQGRFVQIAMLFSRCALVSAPGLNGLNYWQICPRFGAEASHLIDQSRSIRQSVLTAS